MSVGISVKCKRCGQVVNADTELLAELAFNHHVCQGMRPVFEMPHDLILKVIGKELTEAEAWVEADKRIQ